MPFQRLVPAVLIAASCCAGGARALAQPVPVPPSPAALSLDDCLRLALVEHPSLQSSTHRIAAASARIDTARARPQPTLNIDADLQPQPFNLARSGEGYIGVTQFVEFPGVRRARADIARRERDAVQTDAEAARLEVTFEVRRAFYALLQAQERLRHIEQSRELAGGFLKTAETRFAAGDVARVEVVRARVEAAQASTQVQTAMSAERVARAALNVRMGRSQGEPLAIRGDLRLPPVSVPIEDLRLAALAARPELKRLAFERQAEALRETQAAQERWPGVEVGFSHHRIDGEARTWDLTVALPVPLFFSQARKGPMAEARANVLALEREADHQRHLIGLEVEEAFVVAELARDQIRLYEDDILVNADEAFRMLEFSFTQGEVGGLELIAARRELVNARLGYVDALYGHAVALAALDKAVGR